MKDTKAAMKVIKEVGEFIGAYKRCKGSEPEVIYLSKRQIDTLGLEKKEKILGKEWGPA